jgi:16S rRNA (uracil1498-N3)-methyltransferase
MSVPLFYVQQINSGLVTLDEDTSKHMSGVLRLSRGDEVQLTDGRGKMALGVIEDDHRKKSSVMVRELEQVTETTPRISIGISLIKNASRFEWFLEKATEIGINEIYPLVCERTEKEKFREDRLRSILTSAMLQSQQAWMPVLREPLPFREVLSRGHETKFIAHCTEELKYPLGEQAAGDSSLILIGPEGDFTPSEINQALDAGFKPVSLGKTRLRTETAGMVAAVLLRLSGK